MIRLFKEHAARYSMVDVSGRTMGQLVHADMGWIFRNEKGYGPRQASQSPERALQLAEIIGFLPTIDWRALVIASDAAFYRNQRIASGDAR